MEIRVETENDWAGVRAVHLAAFGEQHGEIIVKFVDDLREAVASGEGLSLVFCEDDEVVGHAMFTPALLDAPQRLVTVQVLDPVAVLPSAQNRGFGSALIRRGLELLIERSVPVVFVAGSPSYYARFGFEPGVELGFRKPSLRIPDAAFMAMRLPAYETWMTGTLVYPEAFWRHDVAGPRRSS